MRRRFAFCSQMRSVHRFARFAFVSAAVLVAPKAVRAQDVQSWTMCTPGAFHSCHSVQLMTSPRMAADGTTRVGTIITITMHNLNGQVSQDNTSWSGLLQATFAREFVPTGPFAAYNSQGGGAPVTLAGGATGYANGQAMALKTSFASKSVPNGNTNLVLWSGNTNSVLGAPPSAHTSDVVGGCAPGQVPNLGGLYQATTTAFTCGSSATVSFSFSTDFIIDATGHWIAVIAVIGNGTSSEVCRSGGGGYVFSREQQCDVLSGDNTVTPVTDENGDLLVAPPVVTPEPVTIVLLGTGLLAIGVVQLQRRRKHIPRSDL